MPVLPVGESPALVLLYKIPTEQFVQTPPSNAPTPGESTYAVDIAVEGQPNYPDILPSVWTVKLTISEKDGAATTSATVSPKEAKSSSTMMVEYAVRSHGSCDFKVELEQCVATGYSTRSTMGCLTVPVNFFAGFGQPHHRLKQNAHVFVSLIFYPEKPTKEGSKDRLDLKRLWESQTLSDCTLVCAGQEFPVHRAILAAQSPVFAAMFQNDMLEKSSGVCKIDDIGADVLEMMLNFVYTRAPVEADNLTDLWRAADKYDMEDLRAECVHRMTNSITAHNALQYFTLACERGLTKLKMAAGKFIGQDPLSIT
ncbi:BTB/POZ domain-containing protein 6-like [Paramacrobiotus metropolitanus]|uniref:BTB/POZ domain-containing protein 6-like n=1 Tax=Paramacrobiotus metropolitanus TaxID=2943436 RepID=UPI0024462690|nr:BTB/POZ domain-containing protein 6-like [Paramacrobiotus metropolitanus]